MSYSLLIIDPQNDFCSPDGTLYVPGAEDDCSHLASFIDVNSEKIETIHITLDCHPNYHIAHPYFWVDNSTGKNPVPFTIITYKDFLEKKFSPVDTSLRRQVENYLLSLENRGKYNLTVWPPHCLTATWGFCVEDNILNAVHKWELKHVGKNIDFIKKAANPLTEHYSAIQAEVPDPSDPSTRTNFVLIDKLKEADKIIVAGEALSHCVANTLRDLTVYIPAYKITVLVDCTSCVSGFEDEGKHFMEEFQSKGMQFEKSLNFNWI
ncbi:MAG: isochorismatase family protein [Treponemataceae bacterium]|nr:isochorismatase family protein [Treponemataceae bacterium]